MSAAVPWAPPEGWCTSTSELGSAKRIPFSPPIAMIEPMDAAMPQISVETLGRMYCIVS